MNVGGVTSKKHATNPVLGGKASRQGVDGGPVDLLDNDILSTSASVEDFLDQGDGDRINLRWRGRLELPKLGPSKRAHGNRTLTLPVVPERTREWLSLQDKIGHQATDPQTLSPSKSIPRT